MPRKALVIDNHPLILTMMSTFLERQGYETRNAGDGLTAIDILHDFRPDVLLVDMIMPDICGDKLCPLIRSMPGMENAFIIIVSAIAAETDIDYLSFGANACVAKGPFKQMSGHIASLLRQHEESGTPPTRREVLGRDDVFKRQVSQELLRARQRFEAILNRMSEAVLQCSAERRIIYANPRALAFFKTSTEQLLAHDVLELLPDSIRPSVRQALSELGESAVTFGAEETISINERLALLTLFAVREPESTTSVLIIRDVTEKRRSEEQLGRYRDHLEELVGERTAELTQANAALRHQVREREKTEKALQESESKYRLLVENQHDLLVTLDPALTLSFVSPNYCRTFGRREEELLGHSFLPLVHPEDRERIEQSLQSLSHPPHKTYHEERALTVDGWRWFGWAATAVVDNKGRIDSIVSVGRDITERKEAEAALEESHERLLTVLDSLDTTVYVTTLDTLEILFMNKEARQTFGDGVGKPCWQVFQHNQIGPCAFCRNDKLLQPDGTPATPNIWELHTPVTGRWYEMHDRAIKWIDGRFVKLGIATDISDRKQTEGELRTAKERYQELFEKNPHPMWVYDLDTLAFLAVNDAAVHHYGYSREEFLAMTLADIRPTEDVPLLHSNIATVSDGFDDAGIWQHIQKDGTEIFVETTSHTLDYLGHRAELVLAHDVTRRLALEQSLQTILKGVSRVVGHSFFHNLAQYLTQALKVDFAFIGRLSDDLRSVRTIALCQDGAIADNIEYALQGSPCENVVGKGLCVYPSGAQRLFPEDRLLAELGIESYIGMPLFTSEGNASGLLVAMHRKPLEDHDLVDKIFRIFAPRAGAELERIEAHEALKQAHDELERRVTERTAELEKTYRQLLHAEKLSAVGKLSASIAHEFNNPICGIRNVLDGLTRRAGLGKQHQEMVDLAVRECDRIAALTRDLQQFNRPTSGTVSRLDLHRLLDDILLLSRKSLKNKNIEVVKDFASDLPSINGVADQIKQVFLNLLNNASEAIHGKGGRIVLRTERRGDRAAVQVEDNGSGIRPNDMDKIFEPFFSTKPEVKGTGLGLSVSYGIVKRHGGRIEVASRPGQGATFTVLLPIGGLKI